MKLLFLVNNVNGKGGVEKVLNTLINSLELNFSNFKIEIVSVLSNINDQSLYEYNKNITIHHLEMNNVFNYHFFLKLYKTLKKSDFNYVICLSSTLVLATFIIQFLLKTNSRFKIIAWEHSQYSNISYLKRQIRKIIYPRLSNVISQTKSDSLLFKHEGCNALAIPNPIDLNQTEPQKNRRNHIIAIGRLEYEKGFDLLVKMIGENKFDFEGWKVDIYGEGSQTELLISLINQYKIKHIVELKKFEKNLQEKISGYEMLLSSSRSESFSMVILEALSCSLPVVAFDCPSGPREIIDHDVNGYLVPCFDEIEFMNKTRNLMNNPELRIKMGISGLKKSGDYSMDKIIKQWERVLK